MDEREMADLQAEYEAEAFHHFPNRPLTATPPMTSCYDTDKRNLLITALHNEYKFLCHDDFDPSVDPTPDEYRAMLESLSDDDLLDQPDENVDDFIALWSN